MVKTEKSSPLSDRVFDEIVTLIATGVYGPDYQLPGEHELSQSYDVSRPVLRNALKRLRDEGYVYSRQGVGSFVRRRSNGATELGYMPVDSIADIQRCYEFRISLEPEAAYYAALRRNDDVLEELRSILKSLDQATTKQTHREDADFDFHHAIAVGSNNHYLTSTIKALKSHITVGMTLHGKSLLGPIGGLETVYEEHLKIYQSIESGNADQAKQRMFAHLSGSRDRMFEGRLLDLSM